MTYRYSVSYESDTTPIQTLRGEVDASELEEAINKAVFRAGKQRKPRVKFRSLVVVVEEMAAVGAE